MSSQITPRDERVLEALKTLGPAVVHQLVEWTGLAAATIQYRLGSLLSQGSVHRFPVKRVTPGRPCIYWFVDETSDDTFFNWCKKVKTESFRHYITRLDSLPPVLETRLANLLSMKIKTFLVSELVPDRLVAIPPNDQLNDFFSLNVLKLDKINIDLKKENEELKKFIEMRFRPPTREELEKWLDLEGDTTID